MKHVNMKSLTSAMALSAAALHHSPVLADGDDITKIIAELNHGFEEFKAQMAERDKELKAGLDDYVSLEKLEKINASVSELQGQVDAANARIEAASLGNIGQDSQPDPEYSQNFHAYFTQGIEANVQKSPTSEGGFLAPVEWDRTVTDKLIEVSPMRSLAQVQSISVSGISKLYNSRGTASGWVGETASRSETGTPVLGSLDFIPGEIYANPAASSGMLDDAQIDLAAWIAGEVDVEFALQEGLAFIAGDGTNKPFGFLTYVTGGTNAGRHPFGAIELTAAAAVDTPTADEIDDLVYSLPSAFTGNANFVMNRASQGVIRKIRDADGRSLWAASQAAGQPATLNGFPVVELAGMPDFAASALPVAFGDFRRGYLIVDRVGMSVLRDPFTNKPFINFYTTKRVGGGVNNPEAIKVMQMASS